VFWQGGLSSFFRGPLEDDESIEASDTDYEVIEQVG